jgi:hypothetical protein
VRTSSANGASATTWRPAFTLWPALERQRTHRQIEGEVIPFHARIVLLTQVVVVLNAVAEPQAARAEARWRTGIWFDRVVVDAFLLVSTDARFWSGLVSTQRDQRTAAFEPVVSVIRVDENRLDVIVEAFRRYRRC